MECSGCFFVVAVVDGRFGLNLFNTIFHSNRKKNANICHYAIFRGDRTDSCCYKYSVSFPTHNFSTPM